MGLRSVRGVRSNGAKPPLGPWVELPMGPRSAVLSRGDACEHRHWAFGGPPNGATKRCTWWEIRMRTPPLRPW
eukprot:3289594-Pyramimonas_sp.AAC.1